MIRHIGLGILVASLLGCAATQSTEGTALRQARQAGVEIPADTEISLNQAHAIILALDADIPSAARQNRIRGILGL